MRGKSILALAVALAMIFSVIPAFGLTASAAASSTAIDAVGAEVVWSAPDDANAMFEGWTAVGNNSSNVVVENGTLKLVRTANRNNGSVDFNTAVTSPGYAVGADSVVVAWMWNSSNSSSENVADLYADIKLFDVDGKTLATFTIDQNGNNANPSQIGSLLTADKEIAVVATNNEDGATHKVEYYVDSEIVYTEPTVEGVINGFSQIKSSGGSWSGNGSYIGFENFTVGAKYPEGAEEVQVSYKIEDDVVKTVSGVNTATFPEVTYYTPGANEIYHADAQEVVAAEGKAEIELKAVEVTSPYSKDEIHISTGTTQKAYKIVDGVNLIPNGDFKYGLASWYTGQKWEANVSEDNFILNNDGTVNSTAAAGGTTSSAFLGSFKLEPGTYMFHAYNDTETSNYTDTLFLTDAANDTTETTVIIGKTNNGNTHGSEGDGFPAGESDTVFTVEGDAPKYATIWFRWHNTESSFGKFALYKVEDASDQEVTATVRYYTSEDHSGEPVKTVVKKGLKNTDIVFEAIDSLFVDGKFYCADEKTVYTEEPTVIMDVTLSVQKGKITASDSWGQNLTNGERMSPSHQNNFPGDFTEGNQKDMLTAAWGAWRASFITFDAKPDNGKHISSATVTINSAWTQNGENDTIQLYALNPQYIDEATGMLNKTDSSINSINEIKTFFTTTLDGYHLGSASFQNSQENNIEIDLSKYYLTFPDAEKVLIGFCGDNGLAYFYGADLSHGVKTPTLTWEEAELVKVTVDGKEFTVVPGENTFISEVEGAAALSDGENLYKLTDGKAVVDITGEVALTSIKLGVNLADGAQVRIGSAYKDGVVNLENADSGLRFIGTVDAVDTVAAMDGAEITVEITAENYEGEPVVISIENYQSGSAEDGGIFTAVLKNLNKKNYNRVFTATPVVTVDGQTFKGTSVSRSIFEVSAGILVNGTVDTTPGLEKYEIDDVVKDVLNAYVNAVGVRFTIDRETGEVQNANAYNFGNKDGVQVFDVSVTGSDGVYEYTIEPQGAVKVPDETVLLNAIRINNKHTSVVNGIDNVEIGEDGTITFTFTVEKAVATPAE